MIQEKACPRCAIKRTLWIVGRDLSVCFNCRFVWDGTCSRPDLPYKFTPAELFRLRLYRLAVQAGLYTDVLESQRSRARVESRCSSGESSATWGGPSRWNWAS
jgi:hypothetical protein